MDIYSVNIAGGVEYRDFIAWLGYAFIWKKETTVPICYFKTKSNTRKCEKVFIVY